MRIKRRQRKSAEVPTHSLNDIMFFLLLFFLIIACFTNPNVIKLLTAKASTHAAPPKIPKDYNLEITVDKEYFYHGNKMNNEELQKMLTNEANADSLMLVAIDINQDVDIQGLVDVVSICKKSNAKYYLKDPRAN